MPTPDFLPQGYGYVVASVVSVFWLTLYQARNVGKHRKLAKVKYPQLYAEKAEAAASTEAQRFNCAQRAHQNTLELLPQVVLSTIFVGYKLPIFAASLCGFWTVSRIFYTIGYTTGDPAKRSNIVSTLGNVFAGFGLLLGGNVYVIYELIKP